MWTFDWGVFWAVLVAGGLLGIGGILFAVLPILHKLDSINDRLLT